MTKHFTQTCDWKWIL